MSDKFEYKYSAPSLSERQQIDSIRNQYLPKDKKEEKLEKLKNKYGPEIIKLSNELLDEESN